MEVQKCIELKEPIVTDKDINLDGSIISSILLYVYGEPKTAEQISNSLNLVVLKTQYYLNYLVKKGYLIDKKDKVVDGIINTTYVISDEIRDSQVSIGSEEQLAIQAKRFAKMMEDMIVTMRKDQICGVRATSVYMDEKRANLILEKFMDLHNLMEKYEKECLEEYSKEQLIQYQYMGSFGKLQIEDEKMGYK